MNIESFSKLYQRAAERKGGEQHLKSMLSSPLSDEQLLTLTDSDFLAAFTKKVFQSGFVWRVVEKKWPSFEELFFDFNIEKVLLMSDEMFEERAKNPSIIRNLRKVMTIRDNALMIHDVSRQHGNFARFVLNHDKKNVTALWQFLKLHGNRLGGNIGPYALRALGVDTFILSRDVEKYFRDHELIHGGINSKRSTQTFSDVFYRWHEQSGLPLQTISQIVALAWGNNDRQVS